jgi:hypothetical protein
MAMTTIERDQRYAQQIKPLLPAGRLPLWRVSRRIWP